MSAATNLLLYAHAANASYPAADPESDGESSSASLRNIGADDGDSPRALAPERARLPAASASAEPVAARSKEGQASAVAMLSPRSDTAPDSEKQWEPLMLVITGIAGLIFSSMAVSSAMPVALTAIAGVTLLEITLLALYYIYCKKREIAG